MSSTEFDLVIEAGRAERHYWRDIWRYRELFYFLAWRDILVRYKQTVIGVMWAVIRPVVTMIVFTVVFGKLAKLPGGGAPYPILVFAALLPWQFFSSALSESSNSLVSNSNLLSKVYFPRLIVPASTAIVCLADLLISFVVLAGLMVWYKFAPGWQMLALPAFCLVAGCVSVGAGLWFASLNVKYRDFRYIVPFLVQFGLYLSPVGFDSAVVPAKWRFIYSLNPMVGVIDGFRWAIIGDARFVYLPGMFVSVVVAVLLIISGVWYFRRTERTFADVI